MTQQPAHPEPRSQGIRLQELDALRGLAALAVLWHHFTVYAFDYPGPLRPFVEGKFGVHLFFMISGFVITMTVERQKRVSDFLFARFARLFPPYWVAVLISLAATYFSGMIPDRVLSLDEALVNLTMVQSGLGIINANESFWTLYIELLFYAVVAASIALGLFSRLHWWLLAAVLVDTLAVFPQAWDRVPGWWHIPHVFPLWRHLYLFVFGIWVFRMRIQWSHWFFVAAAVCIANAYGRGLDWQYTLLVTGLGLVFTLAAFGRTPWLNQPLLVWLGTISYSLYLVHENLGYAVIRTMTAEGFGDIVALATAICVSLLIGTSLNRLVERPAHDALRNWWSTSLHRPTPVLASAAIAASIETGPVN